MVVKDTRNVRTGTKSPPEWTPLRRLSSLEKNKGVRKTPNEKMAAKIFEGLKEIDGGLDKVVVEVSNFPTKEKHTQKQTQTRTPPHYQLPTLNSSHQARVQSKTLTPSPDFVRVRRFSLGLDKSPSACKYESNKDSRRNSLGGKSSGSRIPNTGLKPSRVVEKSPLNTTRLKNLGGGEKTQALKSPNSDDKTAISRRPLQSVTLKAARATCSSSCKHVVKGGDLTISPDPRCPYVYCSLNHLHRESPPPLKQFLASRRRLLKTQKSFKWVGLTPVPKGSVDRGDGVETSSVVDTGQDLYVGGDGKDDAGEDDVFRLIGKIDGGLSPSLEDSQIVDCDDYDSGHSSGDALVSELGEDDECNQIETVEHLVDELNARAMDEDPLEAFGAEDDDVKYGVHELGVEASPGDVNESVEEFVKDDVLIVTGKMDGGLSPSFEELDADDECNQIEIVEHLVDELNERAIDEDPLEPFGAEDDDFKYGAHELGVEASPGEMMESVKGFVEDDVLMVTSKMDGGPSPRLEDSQIVDCDDYDSGHSTGDALVSELGADDECNKIEIVEHLVDESNARVMDEEPLEPYGAEDHDIKCGAHQLSVEASPGDVDESVEGFVEDEDLKNGNHELEVEAPPGLDVSIEEFEKDEDVKHDNYEMELEPTNEKGRLKIAGILADESAVEARSDESTELPADNEDVRDGKPEVDVEASASNFNDYGEIEDTQGPCFIQEYTLEAECSLIAEHDGLPRASFSDDDISKSQDGEALSEVDGGSYKDQFEGCVEDYDQIEETRQQCFIQLHVLGDENSGHTEPDSPQVESSSELNSGVKDGVPEGCDLVSGSSEEGSVSEAAVTDYAEQPAGYAIGQIEDTENRCFIQVNSFGNEYEGLAGSDGLPIKVEEEHDATSGSSESGSISHVGAYDHIEHALGSVSDHDQIEDSGQRCFIWLNAQVPECSSHAEPNGLPYAPLLDTNSCIKDEIKGEDYDCVSGNSEDGSAYQVGINNIIEHDNNMSNELNSHSTGCAETECYIQVDNYGMQCNNQIEFDSPPNKSVVDANADSSSKQESNEECIPITGFDGFDNDYNLTSLFTECSDEIRWPLQVDSSSKEFSVYSDSDDELDEALCEFNVNTKFEGEDSHNLVSGDDECVSELFDNDILEHYLECKLLKNESVRTSNDNDDGHAKESGTECKQIKKELKKRRSISEKNENKPYRLKFRRGRVHPLLDQLSEAEKVDLRHQLIEERRASHEWMVDYALTKIVKKLSPFRKRKVQLLVEAFETVIPLSKCETDLPHATTDSTCRRPIQACN